MEKRVVAPQPTTPTLATPTGNPDDRPSDATALYRRLAECPLDDPWDRDRAVDWWTLHLAKQSLEAGAPEAAFSDGWEATVPREWGLARP